MQLSTVCTILLVICKPNPTISPMFFEPIASFVRAGIVVIGLANVTVMPMLSQLLLLIELPGCSHLTEQVYFSDTATFGASIRVGQDIPSQAKKNRDGIKKQSHLRHLFLAICFHARQARTYASQRHRPPQLALMVSAVANPPSTTHRQPRATR